jgi:hypothetical protein
MVLAGLLAALGGPARAESLAPVWGTNEAFHVQAALDELNMAPADAGFFKDVGKPRLALAGLRRLLGEPLAVPGWAGQVRDGAIAWPAASSWAFAASLLELEPAGPEEQAGAFPEPVWPAAVSPDLRPALTAFCRQAARAAGRLERAFGRVARGRRQEAAAFLLAGALRADDDPAAREALLGLGLEPAQLEEAIRLGRAVDPAPAADRFLALLADLRLNEALAAGACFHAAVHDLAQAVSAISEWPEAPVAVPTPWGAIVIGSLQDDRYREPALLILEPGGADRYHGRAGSADGTRDQPLAAILDLVGNDRYEGDALLGPGSALFGVCAILDLAGDDHHAAAWLGQAAALFGTAFLEDRTGCDSYRARALAQAAALAGLAVLDEGAGNDVYDVGCQGQAYADVQGVAWLVDRAGHDRYSAGRVFPDAERHDDRFLSLAQGCAMGWRPFAGGGVAMLADLAGNDRYEADVFGQGVGTWYAAGLLFDLGGHDRYQVFHYGQGSGIHLGLGLLADASGDDRYDGSLLAQGNAHDYSVGLLLDASGNDLYTADQLAQGWGMNNAFGLLLDGAGHDAYLVRQPDQAQGMGNDGGTREYGSLGLLLDLAGRDRYACGARDGARLRRPDFGIVYDVLAPGDDHE